MILAATISVFFMGFSDTSSDVPNATFSHEEQNEKYTVVFESGEKIQQNLTVRYTTTNDTHVSETWVGNENSPIYSGDSYTTEKKAKDDTEIRIIWESGGESYTIGKFEV